MKLEDRIARLEQTDNADMVCPDCAATAEVFTGWCDHRLPPPFDRFVPINIERHLANRKAHDDQPIPAA